MQPVGNIEDEEDEGKNDGGLLVPVDLLKVFFYDNL